MRDDRFWLITLAVAIPVFIVLLLVIIWRVDQNAHRTAEVFDVRTDSKRDPYEQLEPATSTPVVYQNGFSSGVAGSTWGARVAWNVLDKTGTTHYIRAEYDSAWSGIHFRLPALLSDPYRALTISISKFEVSELYVELYDSSGRSIGRQPLSWYYPGHKRVQGTHSVSIPLVNLNAEHRSVAGVALIAEGRGVVEIQELYFAEALPAGAVLARAPNLQTIDAPAFTLTAKATLPYVPTIDVAVHTSWANMWGKFDVRNAKILIGPDSTLAGSAGSFAVFQDGSGWTNYRYMLKLLWGSGQTFSLIARFMSPEAYVACSFSQNGAYAEIYIVERGRMTLLAQSPELVVPYFSMGTEKSVGLEVDGSELRCFEGVEQVLKAEIPIMQKTGTVGVETWDAVGSTVPHEVHSLSVEAI